MKNSKLLLGLIFIFSLSACEVDLINCLQEEGVIVRQNISLTEISKIKINIEAEVIIKEGESQFIEIESTENVIERIISDSEIDSDEWEININGCSDVRDVKIFATLTELESLAIDGSGEISTDGVFNNIDKINLEIDGEGKMDIQIATVEKVDIEVNGSGFIIVRGECQEESIDINGSATINAFDLISSNCRADISGSADVNVYVENNLKVDFKGEGVLCFMGSPNLDLDNSGSGIISDCN